MLKNSNKRIGIDIGALYLKALRLDLKGQISDIFYRRHKGEPGKTLEEALKFLKISPSDSICLTGSNAKQFSKLLSVPYYDITFCQIKAVKNVISQISYIIDVGGGSTTLIELDENGKFQGFATNSLCAAGTGSFLDEQADRLGITYDDMKNFHHNGTPPTIAARCSVFAKSDLIHRQQEGCSLNDMWAGLCQGMTRTLLSTLLNGRPLDGMTAVIGGVALNKEVVSCLEKACPGFIIVPDYPNLIAAAGAALCGSPVDIKQFSRIDFKSLKDKAISRFSWPLTMEKSYYPSFNSQKNYIDEDNNEVRIARWSSGENIDAYMGIDIGSTSTKFLLINQDGDVIVDVYRKTAGDPIKATKLLFKALRKLSERMKSKLTILGVGTTGSGRKIIGILIGADAVINEISAHVAGAVNTDPLIDTIFEIGGQDSKYMHLVDGHIRDANMNYVCAAGTGSFVEELAYKLGYKLDEAGHLVLGIYPPRVTDRCTVFMEQDIGKLIQLGASRKEAFASVMVSVTKNYLNKVVGNRYKSRKKIFFQGATARNPALVAAFERLLNVEMVVSPFCHVMGAYGVALLTRQHIKESKKKSSFIGLDLEKRKVSLRKERCTLCQNNCHITIADIEKLDKNPSWGYMCGRDPDEKKMRVTSHTRFLRMRQRLWFESGKGGNLPDIAPVIGIPQALSTYTYLPLWRSFFNLLGYQIKLSGTTTQSIRELGLRMSGADFCFPAKIFIGHVAHLAAQEKINFIFLPQMMNEKVNKNVSSSTFCPYVQASFAYSRSSLALNGMDTSRILSPLVDMRIDNTGIAKKLAKTLSVPLKKSYKQILQAWIDAINVQRNFEVKCRNEGEKILKQAREKNEKLLVIVGRPYNNFDTGVNLDLPQKIAEQGKAVIPLDFLPIDMSVLNGRYQNTYWSYGQKILAALKKVADDDLLDAVYLTNFSCGPDSFLLSYAEEIMGNKPFLSLELDEHDADAGYMTRIEAFFDVLNKKTTKSPVKSEKIPYKKPTDNFKDHLIWFPNMHPYTTKFFAAAFRCHGFEAKTLPNETNKSFEIGRSVTRGSECLPTSLTIGSLLNTLRSNNTKKKQAFFMPTAQGPCRFGQYCSLHRQILDREGFTDVPILSPSSFNSYQGIDESLRKSVFKAMIAGDILMKTGCRIRPYEKNKGETDQNLAKEMNNLVSVIEKNADLSSAIRKSVKNIAAVSCNSRLSKPLVGIVGEIYVRNNTFANENLINSVEQLGAEAWMSPISEWIMFTSSPSNISEHHAHNFSINTITSYLKWRWMLHWEKKLYNAASPILDNRHEPKIKEVMAQGGKILPANIGGEAILTVGRSIKFAHQNVIMVINVAPFSCMPGTVTTALFRKLSMELKVPIVNLFYDGTGGQNRRLEVFIKNAITSKVN